MAACGFDHLVVAADTLERGVAHVERCVGAACRPGGRHPRMGTHNALLHLGPATYLEVIAIDPAAPPPEQPRWFGLDDPAVQAALAERPRLLTWVARSEDLDAAIAACVHDAGTPRAMTRGDLHWRIAFPDDGALVAGGLVPPLIEWGADTRHPASRLPDVGVRLEQLTGRHRAPGWVRERLAALGLADTLALEIAQPGAGPRLAADLRTPRGTRRLE